MLEDVFCFGGLWKSKEQMEDCLKGLNKADTLTAVKAQLNVGMKIFKYNSQEKSSLNAVQFRT